MDNIKQLAMEFANARYRLYTAYTTEGISEGEQEEAEALRKLEYIITQYGYEEYQRGHTDALEQEALRCKYIHE